MTMLLDTGVLHCDPHPGNLLRTTDGELCILDWGMTLPVPSDLQYALIEFIAHVNAEVNIDTYYTSIDIDIHKHIHKKSSAFWTGG